MHSFKDSKKMPYEAKFINDIIMDVEEYPDFMPWCNNVTIISEDSDETIAKMDVEFKGFKESYTSRIINKTLNKDEFLIEVEAIEGPFQSLSNKWHINKKNNNTKVSFSIDFEFKSLILDKVIGVFFSSAVDKMIEAFENRAKELNEA